MKMTQENENGTLCPETDRKKFEEGGPSSKEQKADPDSLMDLRPPESIKVKNLKDLGAWIKKPLRLVAFEQEPGRVEQALQHDRRELDAQAKNIVQILPVGSHIVQKAAFPDNQEEPAEFSQHFLNIETPIKDARDLDGQSYPQAHLTEDADPDHGKIIRDFAAPIQMDDGEIQLIDIEVQSSVLSAKDLCGRTFYYLSRAISSQKNDVYGFKKDEYGNLKKAVLIWIFITALTSGIYESSFSGFSARAGSDLQVLKRLNARAKDYAKTIVVNVGDDWKSSSLELVRFLGHLFRNLNREEAIQYLEKEGIHLSANATNAIYKYADDYFRALRLYGANWQEGVRQECAQQVEEAQRKSQQKVQEAQRKFQEEQRLRQEEQRLRQEEQRLRQEDQKEIAALRALLKQYQQKK